MTTNMTQVSVLGLGAMGRALAGALLRAGHPTTVWNRTPSRADGLVERGASLAATAAGAIGRSDLAIVCLLDYEAVGEVLAPAGAELAGRTVVNLTNGTPAQAREAATAVGVHGGAYVDGGIMAVPPMIGGPDAFLLYSGDRDAFDRAEPTLAVLGRPVFVGADAGLAALHDIALLSGMSGMFVGARHASALVRSAGVDPGVFTATLLVPWLEAMLALLPAHAGSGEGYADQDSNAAMQVIAVENMITASQQAGVSDELLGHLHSDLHALRALA